MPSEGRKLVQGMLRYYPFVLKNFRTYLSNLYRRRVSKSSVVKPYYAWPEPPKPPKPLIPPLIGPAEVPSFLRDRVALRLDDQADQWDSFASRLASLLNSPTGARDESGYEAARLQQQKGLRQLEEWAKALQAPEEAAAARNGERET